MKLLKVLSKKLVKIFLDTFYLKMCDDDVFPPSVTVPYQALPPFL